MVEVHDETGGRPTRRLTVILLAATVVLAAAAFAVGIADNPPGIALLYAAGFTLVLAGVHKWRQPKRFWLLLLWAAVAFVVSVLLHNFAEVGAERLSHLPVLSWPLTAISVVAFFLAIVVCPAAVLVALAGGLVTSARRPA